MKLRKLIAAFAASAVAVSAMAVSAFAANSTIEKVKLNASVESEKAVQWDIDTLTGIEKVDTVTIKGTASVDGWCGGGGAFGFDATTGWVQVDFTLDGAGVTLDSATGDFTAELDFKGAVIDFAKEDGIMQLGWWWGAGAQTMQLNDLLVNGESVIGKTVPAAPAETEPAETPAEPEETETPDEPTVEEPDDIAEPDDVDEPVDEGDTEEGETEETEEESVEDYGDVSFVDASDYFDGSTLFVRDEEKGGFADDAGIPLSAIYGVKFYVTFDEDQLADEEFWVGGGTGANSDSTGWAAHEWGKASGEKEITPDFENGTIVWFNDGSIFTEDESFAQLWIQTWGGNVTVDSVEVMVANDVAESTDTDTDTDTDAGETETEADDNKGNPDTGVAGVAVAAGVVALAGAAVVVSRKRK